MNQFNGYDVTQGFDAGPWLTEQIPIRNYAKCPACGGVMVDDGMVYTSYPPQYKFICQACGKVAWSRELLNHRL